MFQKHTRKKQLFPRLKAFRGLVLLLLLIPLALLLGEKTSLAAPPPSAAVSTLTTVGQHRLCELGRLAGSEQQRLPGH